MSRYADMIFQAKCQIESLEDAVDQGCKFESCDGDEVVILLSDGYETSVYLEPIRDLLDVLSKLPKPSTEDA